MIVLSLVILFFILFMIASLIIMLLIAPSRKVNEKMLESSTLLQPDYSNLPGTEFFTARDGSSLPYKFYNSSSDRTLLLLHGGCSDGLYLHMLVNFVSASNLAKVYIPELRGFGKFSLKKGDIDYVGQICDDLADLIALIKKRHPVRKLILGGHSTGGGAALKFCDSSYRKLVDGYLLFAPMLGFATPLDRKKKDSGASLSVSYSRYLVLRLLNIIGIRTFNDLAVASYNKPVHEQQSDKDAPTWSYRLAASLIPGGEYRQILKKVRKPLLVICGDRDEWFMADQYEKIIGRYAKAEVQVVNGGITHKGVVESADTAECIEQWLKRHFP